MYLQQYQLIPSARTCEALADLYGCDLSEGALARRVEQASEVLIGTMDQIAEGSARVGCNMPMRPGCGWEAPCDFLPVNRPAFSPIWPGMPSVGQRHWRPLVSGCALMAAPCEIAGPAMIAIAVP